MMTDWSPIEGKTWPSSGRVHGMLDYSGNCAAAHWRCLSRSQPCFPFPSGLHNSRGGLRDTSCWSQHFLFRKPSRLLQIRHSSGTSILRQSHVPGGRSNELEASFLCWHQAPLPARPPLPVPHSPVLLEATPSPGMPTPAFRMQCLQSGRVRSPPFQEVGIPPPAPPARRPAPSLCSPHPRPAPPLRTPFPVLWIQFQVQFCSQGRGGPALYISGFHPAHPQASSSGQPAPPRPSPRFSVPLELPACPSTPPPWLLTLSQDPRCTCPGSGSLHSVCCHQNKEGIHVGSHPFFLMTHHDGVTASLPEEGVSLRLVQSPAPLPGHCYPPLPPCPSTSLAACT